MPDGMENLIIPKGSYHPITAVGKMPDCVANAWMAVWKSAIPRAYRYDFEVYDENSKDWENAEVKIFISVK